jgi:pSer/pThr/pTyr-binding forkhead associated (FHA) protein
MAKEIGLVVCDRSGQRYISLADKSAKIYTIGRHSSNRILIHDAAVSRFHARLIVAQDTWKIIDGTLQHGPSKNGLWLDEKRVLSAELAPGSCIYLGTESSLTLHIFSQNTEQVGRSSDDRPTFPNLLRQP